MRHTFAIGLFIIALGSSSFAVDKAQLKMDLQPRKITVGDPIDLTIDVAGVNDETVIWPGQESFAPAEIFKMDTLKTGVTDRSIRYTISVFETGKVELPDIPITFASASGTDTLWLDLGVVTVESVLGADSTADIKDIRPPVRLKWRLKDLLPYLIIIGSILVLGIVGYLLYRKYKKNRGELPEYVPPPTPPFEIAIRKLTDLKSRKLWQNGLIKEFYSELTEIVKEYIEGRYKFNALEMTTEELFDHKEKWQSDDGLQRKVRRLLTTSDLVKFAKFRSDPSENEHSLNVAFEFVTATKPSVDAEPQEQITAEVSDNAAVS